MTWSAPSERTSSTFLVLQTPVTSAPSALAIWTANVPTPRAEHLVARSKLRDFVADRFDGAREVGAEHAFLRLAQPHLHAPDPGRARHGVPVASVHRGSADPHQHAVL